MLSYHSKSTLKAATVRAMKFDKEAERLIKGQYWEDGKGCHVGCVIKDKYDDQPLGHHEAYEKKLGVPAGIASLADWIFEQASDEYAKEFSVRLLQAIPVGIDLEPIAPEFHSWLLKNELVFDRAEYPECEKTIAAVIALVDRQRKNDPPAAEEWSAARSAAESAASAARSAAESAAWSAALSAASAAWSAAAERFGEKLIELFELAGQKGI